MLLVPCVYKDISSHNPFAAQAGTILEQKFAVLSAHLMGTERNNPSGLKASGYGEHGWSQPCGQGWAPTATPAAIEGNGQKCWELDWKPFSRLTTSSAWGSGDSIQPTFCTP